MIKTITVCLTLIMGFIPALATAEGQFSTVIKVNDGIITKYELDQRTKMLGAFGGGAAALETAKTQLIEERLKSQAAADIGVTVPQSSIEDGMAEFASRGNLSTQQILQYLASRGVDASSYREFVRNGLIWREVVSQRFGRNAQPSEADIDAALGAGQEGPLSVRIAELMVPYMERGPDGAKALTTRLSKSIKSTSAFAAAARKYSRAPSRRNGGLIDWVPASNLPPALVAQLLALEPGEVTDPIELQGASGIFQLRGTRRGASPVQSTVVTYATVPLSASVGDIKTQSAKARVLINRSDRCLDLRANAGKLDGASYSETSSKQSNLSQSTALQLANLDKNEATYFANSKGGTSVIMLCNRTTELPEGEREALRASLFNRKVTGLGQGYLQELRSSAKIDYR